MPCAQVCTCLTYKCAHALHAMTDKNCTCACISFLAQAWSFMSAHYCELCNMWLNSPTQWADHKMARKHRKNLRKMGPPPRCWNSDASDEGDRKGSSPKKELLNSAHQSDGVIAMIQWLWTNAIMTSIQEEYMRELYNNSMQLPECLWVVSPVG